MFENEIREYESVRQEYQQTVADKMGEKQWVEDRHRVARNPSTSLVKL